MTTSPSSGLSPEAKEFVPLAQTPIASIPLYVDENTIASIYPSDQQQQQQQQPLMVQTIYPMMITNSKVTDSTNNNLLQFPEIEFHIQPSQQFHIDSCANIQQQSSTNGNSSTNNTSQIILLPTTNTASITSSSGYYSGPQIIYSTNEQASGFYPIDYCEQPLINFSLQQPTQINKSTRISSQHQRPTSFRQQRGTSYRPSSRGGNNSNRNASYDYNNRRPCSSYTQNPTRGHSSLNSKRISSSYQQHEYNNYYHHPSSRSRGYGSRSSQQHDEQRKENLDYYNHEKDLYENDYHLNDDGTPFEFRPEDFPSLPMNAPQSDKTPPQSILSTNTKSASSWNEIVSAPRPHSTSPHFIPPSAIQSQDSRSDRSRSFNNNNNNKSSTNNERRSSNNNTKKSTSQPIIIHCASITNSHEEQQALPNNDSLTSENNIKDDGFIQTKQQQRRLKRKNKMKEELIPSTDQSTIIESAPFSLDDENAFPTLGQQGSIATINKKSENDSTIKDNSTSRSNQTYQICLTDMFNSLSTSTQNSPNKTSAITDNGNTPDSKLVPKQRKQTKLKHIINQEVEENQKQRPSSKATVDKHIETDTNIANVTKEEYQNSNPLSSSSSNSSDTSDYDDAVDNLDAE